MILEEETYKKFGYYSSDLSPKSKKKILAACDDCGKVRVLGKGDYRPLCKLCCHKGEKVKRICEQCGKEFEVWPSTVRIGKGKFCSRKCSQEASKKQVRRICEYCGKGFEVWPSKIRNGGGKFCSAKCKNESQKTKVKRICETCGKGFEVNPYEVKQGDGRFCSKSCARSGENNNKWKGGKVKRICEACGKEFEVYPYLINEGGGRFCSYKCMAKWRSENMKGESCPIWKPRVKCICEECGKEFEVKQSDIKNGGGKFCSNECHGKWRSEHIRGESSPTWKGGLVKRICEACSKEFEAKPSEIKKGNGRFCSIKCFSEWLSKHNRGENNPFWRGGISFEPYCEKFDEPFKEYIREKFGRICFLCPATEEENGQRLSVHHVNYDKDCLCNDNLTCQFVPLCRSCNARVNFNREEWEKKINNMLHNSLKGWYI